MSGTKASVDEYGTPAPCLKPSPCPCDDPCQRALKLLEQALAPVRSRRHERAPLPQVW